MAKELVIKPKWFWAWQDEKEEAWLTAMAREGYHLEDSYLTRSLQIPQR